MAQVKLRELFWIVKNKRNLQYNFILKKKILLSMGLSPKMILDMKIPIKKQKITFSRGR